jgi:hypothetical protein
MVVLSFQQIEGILGDSLPVPAYKSVDWWTGRGAGVHEQAWSDVGWHVESADLENRKVVLRREKGILRIEKKQRKRAPVKKKTQKPLPKAQPRKRRTPSKTKMAKMVARLRNIERQGITARTYPGQPKSKAPYEKRFLKTKPT